MPVNGEVPDPKQKGEQHQNEENQHTPKEEQSEDNSAEQLPTSEEKPEHIADDVPSSHSEDHGTIVSGNTSSNVTNDTSDSHLNNDETHTDPLEALPESQQEDVTEAEQESNFPNPLPKINHLDAHLETPQPNGRHSRVNSVISTASFNSSHISFVKTFITAVTEQKDAKKLTPLLNSAKKTLDKLESSGFNSLYVFDTLRLACESKIPEIVVLALDCFSKIFTFQLFEPIQVSPSSSTITAVSVNESTSPQNGEQQITPPPKVNLIDAAIETIASTFDGEGTDQKIEVQVVRALVAGVLNDILPAHGQTLLRAVRQIYNIFILSLSPANQGIAQASLTQVVNVVFDKVEKLPGVSSSGRSNSSVRKSVSSLAISNGDLRIEQDHSNDNSEERPPLTLESLNKLNDEEEKEVDQQENFGDEDELVVKDAFLLLRAMCRLSTKSLDNGALDMRSHAVRSKLISLHVIHSIIKEHIDVFTSNNILVKSSKESTKLVDAARQYIRLTIARNGASAISPVFETTLEIFWLIISNLRSQFKDEIPVFLDEIYFPVAELKTSTPHQKRYFLIIIQRLSSDPRALIEFYLNYDCDSRYPNIVEKLTDYLTKLALTRAEITPHQRYLFHEQSNKSIATYNLSQLPLLSISKLSSQSVDQNLPYPIEYALKVTSLKSIVGILRSLNSWAQRGLSHPSSSNGSDIISGRARSSSGFLTRKVSSSSNTPISPLPSTSNLSEEIDDPQNFENLKQRKTALQEGIRLFNFKPKKGIEFLVKNKFLEDRQPVTIARFLLDQHGLDKAVIGEYLGDGDDENIKIMHAFVDEMEFKKTGFVDSMRLFLQSFRLPGEAQKIDRYMLKFAERYVDGNPGVFANADTAYVLAYSVVMLNTDQHSKNVKNRMTVSDFIKNNRGIDDGKDLPEQYLTDIFNIIATDEIKLQSEQHAALLSGDIAPAQQGFGFLSNRDVNREAYIQASKEISNKTEQLFKSLSKTKYEDTVFYQANHIDYVRSIFDNLWMSFLAALTPPFKELDDEDTIKICLEGLKLSISISAIFELDYARRSFIGALVQFTNLSNIQEIKDKNVEAIVLLLKIAETLGDQLKDSWKDILTVISQVERLQLIAKGIQADVVPDITTARVHRSSLDSQRTNDNRYSFFGFGKKATLAEQAQTNHHNQHLDSQIGHRLISTELTLSIDKIFTESSALTGTAIIEFITALTEVASEEIESSLESSTPRTFSLQKVIDVCYYNMNRIRLEWSPIWNVIGGCLNSIGTKHNLSIVFFALDSLRQLSMRFFDIEELAGFKFQEEFLKPFDYILKHERDVQVTEMVLNCLNNLIILKGSKIKSGWKTIFASLEFTASDSVEATVNKTHEIVNIVYKDHSEVIFAHQDAFEELIKVLKALAKNSKFQRISLQSLHTVKSIVFKISEITVEDSNDDSTSAKNKDLFKDFWYPALSSFNDIIMTGDDLEVRSRALNYLFDILVQYGSKFDGKFWDEICVELLFPIFGVLSKHWEINQFNSHDDLSVWLSTTLIQALRNMIALFTHYFSVLNPMLDGYLGLLVSCICQENDTIARIGRSCLEQLITQNMENFTDEHWEKITEAFEKLFELTMARELFEADPLRQRQHSGETSESKEAQELNGSHGHDSDVTAENDTVHSSSNDPVLKPKSKNTIVVKCILQLLMIESLSELFENERFYELISYKYLIRLSSLLEESFRFARKFNDDYNLRVRLWSGGVIEKLPNLLKQESSAAAVYINTTFKVYSDVTKITPKQKDSISSSLIPLCVSIIERYVQLDDATQQRNIVTWRPVVVEILQGYCELEEKDFVKNCPHVYDLVLNILDKSVPSELRTAIKAFFGRVGDVYVKDEVEKD